MFAVRKKLTTCALSVVGVFGFSATANALVTWNHSDGSDHIYEIVYLSGSSWGDADAHVQSLGDGWHLATITSQEEQSFLETTLFPTATQEGKYWLGGIQDDTATAPDEGWSWVTGEMWDYTNFSPAQPDDFGGQVQSWLITDSNANWEWADFRYQSANMLGYIAERSVPEPGALALFGLALALMGFVNRNARRRQIVA
jgi:hypothetical protein